MPIAPPKHRPAHYKDRAQKDRERGSARKRGYDGDWERTRAAWLAVHPLCQCDDCREGELQVTAASVVDHIVPISVAPERRLDPTNFRSMSKACHDRHTAKQVAGGHIGMRGRRG
ncbi:MAG: HNH endonuclease [Reyranellaceae bacterium]